ncbi:hypothetical protein LOD99_1450 [Oopsacas minuta]|uniref:Uncharacterized protein n=1 Tax=Oopsacas minuta TaxID=111878 RepID=A0AAV7K4E5_9METZ|nr:hypothetical protein LOD99_1450 [Oopsacas minuta]
MKPEIANRIWGHSSEKNHLTNSVFDRFGHSLSIQQMEVNPYNLLKIRKEKYKTHVVKHPKKKKRSMKNNIFVQHALYEWKVVYITANYSTVIYQHRGLASIKLCSALHILVDNAAGDHSGCLTGEK